VQFLNKTHTFNGPLLFDLACGIATEIICNETCSITSKAMVSAVGSEMLFCHEKRSLNVFQSLETP
jgi:hypothetical protein